MNVKIFYRSATVWNIILFTFLSFFFLYFQEGLLFTRSVFEKDFLRHFLVKYAPFHALVLVTAVSIYKMKGGSKALFLLTALSACLLTVNNLTGDFSKLITIALFLYILTVYYFYQFLDVETCEAYYNPLYNDDDLFQPMLKKLPCELEDASGNKTQGWLTNWNPNGCFVYLEEPNDKINLKDLTVHAWLENRPFRSKAFIASKASDGKGIGLKIENKPDDEFGWRDYYRIADQMGYNVELLK